MAREESRRKKANGVFEISEPHELLFSNVAKEVVTLVVQGVIVDYRPPLFVVAWSDSSEGRFTKKELDHFRRLGDKHKLLAEQREKARVDRLTGKKRPDRQRSGSGSSNGSPGERSGAEAAPTPQDVALEEALALKASSKGMLEWRLLEVASARMHQLKAKGSPDSPGSGDSAATTPQRGEGVVFVRHCATLAKGGGWKGGGEPSDAVWRQAGSAVTAVSLLGCGLQPLPPRGLRALPCLQFLDLSSNQLLHPDPAPLPPPPLSELEKERLKQGKKRLSLLEGGNAKGGVPGGSSEASSDIGVQPDGGSCSLLKTLILRSNKLGELPDSDTRDAIAASDAANTAAGGSGGVGKTAAAAGSSPGSSGGSSSSSSGARSSVRSSSTRGGGRSPVPGKLPNSCFFWCRASLEVLDLSDNPSLTCLPGPALSGLSKLRVLRASHCSLDRLATQVWSLLNLEELDLENNCLTSLVDLDSYNSPVPPKLEKLKSLKCLKLGGNAIQVLPQEVWFRLPSLTFLDVARNFESNKNTRDDNDDDDDANDAGNTAAGNTAAGTANACANEALQAPPYPSQSLLLSLLPSSSSAARACLDLALPPHLFLERGKRKILEAQDKKKKSAAAAANRTRKQQHSNKEKSVSCGQQQNHHHQQLLNDGRASLSSASSSQSPPNLSHLGQERHPQRRGLYEDEVGDEDEGDEEVGGHHGNGNSNGNTLVGGSRRRQRQPTNNSLPVEMSVLTPSSSSSSRPPHHTLPPTTATSSSSSPHLYPFLPVTLEILELDAELSDLAPTDSLTHLSLQQCGLTQVPPALGALAYLSAVKLQTFETRRRKEIIEESSSSDEDDDDDDDDAYEKETVSSSSSSSVATAATSKSGSAASSSSSSPSAAAAMAGAVNSYAQSHKSDHSGSKPKDAGDASSASGGAEDSGAPGGGDSNVLASKAVDAFKATLSKSSSSSSNRKSSTFRMAAKTAMRAAKKAAKRDRREQVAPCAGTDSLTALDLSNNALTHFPGVAWVSGSGSGGGNVQRNEFTSTSSSSSSFPGGGCSSAEATVTCLSLSFLCRHLKSLTVLNLSSNALEGIDPLLFQAPHGPSTLTSLDLSRNRLSRVPSTLGSGPTASSLTALHLDHNQLQSLPATIGGLSALTKLTASFNDLGVLPLTVSRLRQLRSVSLSNNPRLEKGTSLLGEAMQKGQRAAIRLLLDLPLAHSLAHQAAVFKPLRSTGDRWLAGGFVAADEAKLDEDARRSERGDENKECGGEDNESAAAEEEEARLEAEARRKAKPRPAAGGAGGDVLVFDHHGDRLNHETKMAYLCKNYSLYYEVERVLPPKRPPTSSSHTQQKGASVLLQGRGLVEPDLGVAGFHDGGDGGVDDAFAATQKKDNFDHYR